MQDFRAAFEAGRPEAIAAYFSLVLDQSVYPEGFPEEPSKVLYLPESRQILVEYELPQMDKVIPTAKAYKYVKAKFAVTETPRPESQRRSLYGVVVAQTVLRCLNEVIRADTKDYIDSVLVNAHVSAINPGTGQPVRPCLVTVRTTKDVFRSIDLSHVEPAAWSANPKRLGIKEPR